MVDKRSASPHSDIDALIATPITESAPDSAELVTARNARTVATRELKALTAAHGSTADRRALEARVEAADAEVGRLEPPFDEARVRSKEAARKERRRRAPIYRDGLLEEVRAAVPLAEELLRRIGRMRTIYQGASRDFGVGQGIVPRADLQETIDYLVIALDNIWRPILDPPRQNGHKAVTLLRIVAHPTPATWPKRRRMQYAELPISRTWCYAIGDLVGLDKRTAEFLLAVGCAEEFTPDAPMPTRDLDGLDAVTEWNRRNFVNAREWRISRGIEKES